MLTSVGVYWQCNRCHKTSRTTRQAKIRAFSPDQAAPSPPTRPVTKVSAFGQTPLNKRLSLPPLPPPPLSRDTPISLPPPPPPHTPPRPHPPPPPPFSSHPSFYPPPPLSQARAPPLGALKYKPPPWNTSIPTNSPGLFPIKYSPQDPPGGIFIYPPRPKKNSSLTASRILSLL